MEEILARIEKVRNEMINIGMSEGFRSDKTLKLSKQLDGLILQYQILNKREKQIS
ncbi:aspartyl-phosphate phosphatase Spo0E family protein [Niallia taxi]|nr:aspartyl-phosphate phosphatase Spo0E family protein [Niallia taxi]MDE5055361.1 aspartyl-phosphate phosphatase Spo0E family protein [Niallia taxi]